MAPPSPKSAVRAEAPRRPANNLQRLREDQLLTKAELARKAGVSPLTVARIEAGQACRVDTKRKIILALGMTPSDRAKVFGGGNVLRGFTSINVGERNARFVREFLDAENIRIVAEDLNDVHPRKVYYFPQTGKVLVKKLKQLNNYTLVKREQDYASRLKTNDVAGDVDLF